MKNQLSNRRFWLGCLLLATLGASGCAGQIGSRGPWELWAQGSRLDGMRGLHHTAAHLDDFNDFSDVGMTWYLMTETGREGGFLVAVDDFFSTFLGPYSFNGFGDTFRHLRH